MTAAGAAAARREAGPHSSVWVSASAGTGKTTVLTQRLLRLMLDGTDPARVLCLTFTRAAAAEMANRLDARLAEWATMPPGALAQALRDLTGAFPGEETIARARRLFALVLDAPGGIKIATIHAFCQTLLRRFPLEAGVSPEFAVVEERGAGEALAEAAQKVILAARDGRNPELAEALAIVAGHAAEERFAELMQALAQERGKLRRALADGHSALRQKLSAALSVPVEADAESLVEAFCAADAGDEAGLRAVAAALAAGSSADSKRGAVIAEWCTAPQRRREMLAAYECIYLTEKGEIREKLITQPAARKAAGDAEAILAIEAQRLRQLREARAGTVLRDATCALARLGEALLRSYDEGKRLAGVLDFDDLVETARDLLRRPGVAPWVLFKLDGGLDHILIDEAQDTNPEQWEIVAALAEEFFAGEGAEDRVRTVFAVGDAKQSIYSFQRADPQEFLRMRQHFQEQVSNANRDWKILPLEVSFRSTEPVLRAVDAIFRQPEARDGVALDGGEIRHFAARAGHAGRVELWPAVPAPRDEPLAETLPIAHQRTVEPWARLARAIAATVGQWLETGERLEARGRPLRPGDIMVLVRRRNEFVGELLRALKGRGIPVAGADRLVLTEQLAVQDLVALGRFLLFPEDDLTLATVLKGPLFDLDEDTLFELCHGRGDDRLWARLRAGAHSSAKLRPVAERLAAWLARADFAPPYELYGEILGAERGRHALLRRLGPEADDPVEEFLGLALAYEREHAPSLQGFLRWLVAGDTEVKRDFAARRRDEVRVLTVHGAKGLEAPVVFVPDTMALPDQKTTLMWAGPGELPLWKPPGDHVAPFYRAEKEAWRRRQLQEYRRLLYVGLTRAQDRLYICGWQTRRQQQAEICWHALCRAGLAGHAQTFDFDAAALIGDDGWSGEGLRLDCAQTARPAHEAMAPTARAAVLPDWASAPPPVEPDPPRPLFPSRPSGEEPPATSPLALGGRDRFKRGLLVHRLLQSLPELPEGERDPAARRFLALPTHGLAAAEQDEIRQETLAVLGDPEFVALFGPGSQAEVPLVGLVDGHALSGQIDRLIVAADRVLIVDYKTMRPVPASEAEVAPIYLRQLAIYRAALARIYPGRDIRCALLWTQGPLLMPISPERLAGHAS
ncbi:MAG TPA: double-strand break repair helicase AddA [Stellaceae bacterium]|jgi:ATP-dependent helicase/nuclease subunit A